MKYAEQVIELLECFPGRDFRMAQIVRYVNNGKEVSTLHRHAVRKGVERVLRSLCDSGQVSMIKDGKTSAYYIWKM